MKNTKKTLKSKNNQSCKTCSNDFVKIRSDAFAFCRYGIMLMVWSAFIFKIEWLVLLTFAILAISAIFTVQYAPMILLYNNTAGLLFKGKTENLGIGGMRFAHILGSIFSGIAILFLYIWSSKIGWIIVLFLAIMKTISAIGLCPAYKVYNCMKSGGCCSLTKK